MYIASKLRAKYVHDHKHGRQGGGYWALQCGGYNITYPGDVNNYPLPLIFFTVPRGEALESSYDDASRSRVPCRQH